MKVLIVDDNQMVASAVQLMLELEGYEIRLALNGPDGYLAYLQFRPNLVITDIQMPGENGFELMNHIREKDTTVKTIYMSGNLKQFHSLLEEEKSKYQIKYLEKPFSLEELIGRVSELEHQAETNINLAAIKRREMGPFLQVLRTYQPKRAFLTT